MLQDAENFSVKTFKDQLTRHRIALAFHGMFSHDVLTLIGNSLKNSPDSGVIAKRLFAIVVEMAQNIHHYSAEKEFSAKDKREIGLGIVAVGEADQHYAISSGNYIWNKDVDPILARSRFINKLDRSELREYYRVQRKTPQRKDKPGANLGFIDMVRKSGNPVDVMIRDYDDEKSFFILTVKVDKTLAK
jgi:hypothetical protein